MKRRGFYLVIVLVFALLSVSAVGYVLWGGRVVISEYKMVGRGASIRPDYSGTVIPANIAPLNFVVEEEGVHYSVRITSKNGEGIEVFSRSGKISIPVRPWRRLLSRNKGEELCFDIFVKEESGQWERFDVISNRIADEEIDDFLVYRKIYPIHNTWGKMELCQRRLGDFEETTLLDNRFFGWGCVNCHTFCDNRTDKMLMHVRTSKGPSMILIEDGKAANIDSRSQFGSAPIGHTAWHPSGKMIVFTVYNVVQFFHMARREVRDVVDLDSSMGYYLLESGSMKSTPALSDEDYLETFGTWSADGRYLYFCRAPILWPDRETVPPENFEKSRYSLMRISYDIESDIWGELETVLSAEETGLSIIQPRISSDGRFLLFCMCEYSGFPAFQSNSDLYMMELSTGRYERLECSSDESESWHSWSSNGRWIVFSSKMGDGLFIRPYFSYIDEDGRAYKPFVLPQKDAGFYDSYFKLFQIPELITSPVPLGGGQLVGLIQSGVEGLGGIAITSATPAAKAEPWQWREGQR